MADDLGWGDATCYDPDTKALTPNMDALAAQGMRFTDAHTPSAVCTPTRYGVLTGRYCWRSRMKKGVLGGVSPLLIEDGRATVASMLKQYGYATAGVGKWHLGLQAHPGKTDYSQPLTPGPVTVGFDYYYGIPASLDMSPYVWIENNQVVALPTETIPASGHRRQGGGGFWRGGGIAPGFKHVDVNPTLTAKSVEYIQAHTEQAPDQPYFLYIPLAAPHTPWVPSEAFDGATGVDPPGGYYTDFVTEVDWTLGQVMAAVERSGQADNTIIIMTSDNGAHWYPADIERHNHRANGPWRGQKADIHEGGHRVPFIVSWPGKIEAGSVSDQTVCLVDLFATSAAIVGHRLDNGEAEDSYSLLPILMRQQGDAPLREATVHHSLNGAFAIRRGNWKLIPGNLGSGGFTAPADAKPGEGQPQGQLYNLAEDPAETTNVYNEHPEVVESLMRLLDQYRESGRSRP